MFSWISSWATTLRIMFFERDTYRFLRDSKFREEDFIEVPRPGEGA